MKAYFKNVRLKIPTTLTKATLGALAERDETADIWTDAKGNPEPAPELRNYANVPLKNWLRSTSTALSTNTSHRARWTELKAI